VAPIVAAGAARQVAQLGSFIRLEAVAIRAPPTTSAQTGSKLKLDWAYPSVTSSSVDHALLQKSAAKPHARTSCWCASAIAARLVKRKS